MQGDLIKDLHFDPKSTPSQQDVELIDSVFKSSTVTKSSHIKSTLFIVVVFMLLSNHYCEGFIARFTPNIHINILIRTIIFLLFYIISQILI